MMDPRTYVTEQISTIIGKCIEPNDEQINRWWALLSREEERQGGADVHGNFPPQNSVLTRLGLLEEPPLNADIASFAAMTPEAPPRWPNGKRFAACLTHDVDRIVSLPWRERARQARQFAGKVPISRVARLAGGALLYASGAMVGKSDFAPFDAYMAMEEEYGFRSTFFVLPEQLSSPTMYDHYYRYSDPVLFHGHRMKLSEAIRLTAENGWEIGLHGSYASSYDAEIFQREKGQLEAALEADVPSSRQHFLRFSVIHTLPVLAGANIQSDSTLGYSSAIGCRAGLTFPFFWAYAPDVLEAPLIIQDVALLPAQRPQESLTACSRALALIKQIADTGGVVTLSWHTHPEHPAAYDCYRNLLCGIAHMNGWGCTLDDLNLWWRARRNALSINSSSSNTQTRKADKS